MKEDLNSFIINLTVSSTANTIIIKIVTTLIVDITARTTNKATITHQKWKDILDYVMSM
jgi:hypothetical protein